MKWTGGCYCGALRYSATGEPVRKALCFCRECQHVAGGGPNVAMLMRESDFAYTQGNPRSFARADLDVPVRREFCEICGTHVVARTPRAPGFVVIKVGSLDDPGAFGMPDVAGHAAEKQVYHCIPPDVAVPGT